MFFWEFVFLKIALLCAGSNASFLQLKLKKVHWASTGASVPARNAGGLLMIFR